MSLCDEMQFKALFYRRKLRYHTLYSNGFYQNLQFYNNTLRIDTLILQLTSCRSVKCVERGWF